MRFSGSPKTCFLFFLYHASDQQPRLYKSWVSWNQTHNFKQTESISSDVNNHSNVHYKRSYCRRYSNSNHPLSKSNHNLNCTVENVCKQYNFEILYKKNENVYTTLVINNNLILTQLAMNHRNPTIKHHDNHSPPRIIGNTWPLTMAHCPFNINT